MTLLLGIDIGTTTICGVAVSAGGELCCAVERPNDAQAAGLPRGRAEQDPIVIRRRCLEVLAELAGRVAGEKPAAIGLTGQMHGMLCLDADNRPLGRLITWQDQRCLEPAGDGLTWIEAMRSRVPDEEWQPCGCLPAAGFLGSTLYWLVRNHALPAGTQRVAFIHDWLAAALAGTAPTTDPGDAASSGLFDLARMKWHDGIVRALDLPGGLLPPVRESGQVLGGLTPEIAAAVGLPAGTPVCNATGDNQASVLGSIAEPDRSVLVNLGTGGQISWAIPAFRREPDMETRYLPPGRYMLVGASLCGGRAYGWLNDVVRGWLAAFGVQLDRQQVYARLNELAASAPADCRGLTADTALAGTRGDASRRGAFLGVSLDNFDLPCVARAVLAGAVEELCRFHDRHGPREAHDRVVASGNAVRKNPLLRRLISGRMRRPVLIPAHREEAAFGAALLAGVGTGVFRDAAEAGRCVRCLADEDQA